MSRFTSIRFARPLGRGRDMAQRSKLTLLAVLLAACEGSVLPPIEGQCMIQGPSSSTFVGSIQYTVQAPASIRYRESFFLRVETVNTSQAFVSLRYTTQCLVETGLRGHTDVPNTVFCSVPGLDLIGGGRFRETVP